MSVLSQKFLAKIRSQFPLITVPNDTVVVLNSGTHKWECVSPSLPVRIYSGHPLTFCYKNSIMARLNLNHPQGWEILIVGRS